MAKPADNGVLTVVEGAFGGSTVAERKEAMLEGLTAEEVAARNVVPTAAPDGQPHRMLSPELYSENDTYAAYLPKLPNDPGPASEQPLKSGVLSEAQKITDRIGVKVQPTDPEYWGLASVMTDEEAALTACMKVRKPQTFAQLKEASGLEGQRLQELLDDLAAKGILEYNWENLDGKNPNHEKRYVLPMFVPGSAEFTVMNQAQIEEHPEIATFFERMSFLPLTKVTKMVPPGGAGVGMHVIPVQRAIQSHNEAADVERISHWLKKYDRFAAGSCSCRIAERVRGGNGGSDPQNWCIAIGDMADYLVETGKGHFITLEEVLNILLLAEKNGYVHQITNIDGQDKIFAICNCDVNVCYALRTSQLFNTPNMSRSAYTAEVDAASCVACGGCVEVCPAGAVQLGQKLPGKTGPLTYPRQPLPTLSWNEENWDTDYKNSNRIECHETGTAPRVCNRRCEAACTRGTVDEAVAIDEVKRFVAEQDLSAEHRFVPQVIPPTTRGGFSEKIAIVGAGPAGLTCAYYLALLGYKPVVFEKREKPGGMMAYGIPPFKLSPAVVEAVIDVLRELGVEIRCNTEVGRDVTLDELRHEGFCGRVCNRRCEAACTRGTVDEAVAIDEVKRFVAEQDLSAEHRFVPQVIPPTTRGGFSEKIAIVGAGPAGLTCAYYLALLGYKPVVFEKREKPGGMMAYGIPPFKLSPAVVEAEIDVLRELGVEIRCNTEVGRDVTLDELRHEGFCGFYLAPGAQKGLEAEIDVLRELGVEIRCNTEVGRDVTLDELRHEGFCGFYLAPGAQKGRVAGVPGEEGPGVSTAMDFLAEALGNPDAQLTGPAVVVGGGNVAIDAARCALRMGAGPVTMVCLERPDEMAASAEEIEEALSEGVQIMHGWGPAEVVRGQDELPFALKLRRCVRVFDEEGRFAPLYEDGETCEVECREVVMAIGQSIDWGGLLDGSAVEVRANGTAVANSATFQTNQPDVFVGGDAFTGPQFVIDAIAAGHEAAVSLHCFAQKGSSLITGRNPRHYVELDKETAVIAPGSYDEAGRNAPACVPASSVRHNWEDPRGVLTEQQVAAECARCLSCGAAVVDPNKCIGCGLCTTRCEFDAIHLHRDHPECSTMVPSEKKMGKILPHAGKMLVKKITGRE